MPKRQKTYPTETDYLNGLTADEEENTPEPKRKRGRSGHSESKPPKQTRPEDVPQFIWDTAEEWFRVGFETLNNRPRTNLTVFARQLHRAVEDSGHVYRIRHNPKMTRENKIKHLEKCIFGTVKYFWEHIWAEVNILSAASEYIEEFENLLYKSHSWIEWHRAQEGLKDGTAKVLPKSVPDPQGKAKLTAYFNSISGLRAEAVVSSQEAERRRFEALVTDGTDDIQLSQ